MCGVAALLGLGADIDVSAMGPMIRAVAHRGPDGEGVVVLGGAKLTVRNEAKQGRVALGHRRLSILDLSEAGHQPMRRGDWWISYNGEVFNYLELRTELAAAGHRFITSCDTEVILAAVEAWGIDAFARMRGMWGIVLVNSRTQQAWLSRDRMGIKPLYLMRDGQTLAVASEPKQLGVVRALIPHDDVVASYLQSGFEPTGHTFFAGVTPLPAGTTMIVDLRTGDMGTPVSYWSPDHIRATITDADEAADRFGAAFADSMRQHLRSDVAVGCALSGGLDSSAVAAEAAAVLQEQGSDAQVQAFSATFPGFALDESSFIHDVADRTHAQLFTVQPTPEMVRADMHRFIDIHDEPPGSLSQYAAYAVARLTRQQRVPVSLNGQGGDEVLLGYWQTVLADLAAQRRHPLEVMRRLAPALLPNGNRELFRQMPAMMRRFRQRSASSAMATVKTRKGYAGTPGSLAALHGSDGQRRVFALRELTLPRLLKWDDRNFMAFAVEGRYPFLDVNVMEACLAIHPRALMVRGWTKEPLRRAYAKHLPESVIRRREKVGFETPQQQWLQGALRPWLHDILDNAGAEVWQWVDRGSIAALRDSSSSRESSQALVRVAFVQEWLSMLASR
jgi:asparagine synthase (glutamine-hydrolysing)